MSEQPNHIEFYKKAKIGDRVLVLHGYPLAMPIYGVIMDKYLVEQNASLDILLDNGKIIESQLVFSGKDQLVKIV